MSWLAYDRIQPIGPERNDLGLAQICCIIAQVNAKKGKRFKPSDFMPFLEAKRQKTALELEQSFMRYARMHNNTIGKK